MVGVGDNHIFAEWAPPHFEGRITRVEVQHKRRDKKHKRMKLNLFRNSKMGDQEHEA